MPAPLYLCVHLRDFAAQALVCSHFALHSRVVAVLSGDPPLERVFAVTPQARQLGMEEGMSRVQAESFSVTVIRRNRRQEEASFTELMNCTQRFSPRMEVIASPQEERCGATLLLDISGSERLFGSATQVAVTVWQSVCDFGYEASIASARRASAALLAARGTPGVTTIAPGREAETLADLPLSVLEPDVAVAQTFESWGIHTLRQLAALPTKPLAARLGQSTHARVLLMLAILFLLRDQWVSFLRSLGALHALSAKANWSGKARTLISFPIICVIYYYLQAPPQWGWRLPIGWVYALEGLSMLINLISIGVYTLRFWPALRAELRLSSKDESDEG